MGYWKNNLLIGVPQIDDQHKKLVGAIDDLMEACTKGQGRNKIDKTLAFVVAYTKEHFADEERIQAEYSHPEIMAHRLLHKQFLKTASELVKEYEQTGPTIVLVGKLNKYLVDWVVNHISVEDKKIGEYINRHH